MPNILAPNRVQKNDKYHDELMADESKSEKMIYLDNNATTQIDPEVVEEMLPFLTDLYGNPSSGYQFAARARKAIDVARNRLAVLLGCDASELIFTSGGTESNNAAINSALHHDPSGKHIVITAVEHSAVRRHAEEVAERGCEVTVVGVDEDGNVDLEEIKRSIRANTAIVSMMWANNETGVLFPVEDIAEICREKGVLFHTDAVQVVGKISLHLRNLPINFLSLSSHKFHGPKGVGALYVNKKSQFVPSIIGGSHERNRRAGTENVPSIVGLGRAAELASQCLSKNDHRVQAMRDRFEAEICGRVKGISVNGLHARRLTNTSNLSIAGIESQAALIMLDRAGICCSAGSACKTGSTEGSHVLRAMRGIDERAGGTLRFSFGRFNSDSEVEQACGIVPNAICKLRELSRLTSPALPLSRLNPESTTEGRCLGRGNYEFP
jgi:cysteine desulfurase